MLKIGVVGCGGISGAHIPSWLRMEDVEVTAICDIRPEKSARYENIKSYVNFDEMLDENDFDIIDICLPTFLHTQFALKAMNRGIHVITEKPLSLKEEDIRLSYESAKKNNVRFMTAQVLRFWNEYDILKKIYDSKQYGELLSGTMFRLGGYPSGGWNNWYHNKELSGSIPFDLHIHDLDFLVYAFGEPESYSLKRQEREDQDYLSAVYDYGKFFITAEASWFKANYPFYMGFRFQFENAVAALERDGLTIYEAGGKRIRPDFSAGSNNSDFELPSSDAYFNELRYFADCVKNNTEVTKVTEESLITVNRILRSIK